MSGRRQGTGARSQVAGGAGPATCFLAALLLLLLAGCAGRAPVPARPAPALLPPESPLRSHTLAEGDAWFRHHLMYGHADSALALLRGSGLRPPDPLLRALQEGLLLHRAGEHARSNEVLEWAVYEAEQRYTRSLSRAAASLAVNDRVLAYTPSFTELAMVPFYRMLNHLALGDREGALVEARRANALLARGERDPADRCAVDGVLLNLAGVVQLDGGERNDGLVSLRQAERAYRGCGGDAAVPPALGAELYRAARALGIDEVRDSAAARYGVPPEQPGRGEVLVVVEQGFAAHRAAQALHLPLYPGELEGLSAERSDSVEARAGSIGARILADLTERAAWGEAWDDRPLVRWGQALEGAYLLRVAWPVARREGAAPAAVRVRVGDDSAAYPAPAAGALSEALERELEAQRPRMLARLVARGLLRYLVTREVEEKAEEEGGELLGYLAGRVTNLAANELERADTRSWSLLPDRLSLVRLPLPAGEHRIRLEVVGAGGEGELRDLGLVAVRAGERVVLSERVWGSGAGGLSRSVAGGAR